MVQTNASISSSGGFNDLTPAIAVPADFTGPTTNYLHQGVLTNSQPLFYRVKLLL
jgi:hypothetical protein